MKKGDKKKQELQQALKELSVEKGYANVTMKDIGKRVGLSVGGLYHHYHSIEEIFGDLIESETEEVYGSFDGITDFDTFMVAVDAYFKQEKKELLSEEMSINIQMLEYYFSFPEQKRLSIMKASHDEAVKRLAGILLPVYKDKKLTEELTEHIYVTLQGLVILSASGVATAERVDSEFRELKEFLRKNYEE